MRRMKTVLFSTAAVAVAGLLAAPAAMATGGSCTFNLSFDTEGPCPVNLPSGTSDPSAVSCLAEGTHTGIKYTNTGSSVDHLATLVTRNNAQIIPISVTGKQVYGECVGDVVTGLGKNSCHEKAVKINGIPAGQSFWIIVPGRKTPIETSIAAKKNCAGIKSIPIIGLGLDLPPIAPVKEVLTHGSCSVEFTLDGVGGSVLSAKLVNSAPSCSLITNSVQDLQVTIPGASGPVNINFGQGYFESGTASCTTRVIGGRAYTWGDPCPEP